MKLFAAFAFAAVFSVQAAPQMCFTKAGQDFGIDPRMRNNALNTKSSGGTNDVCNMQINSSYFIHLKRFDITRERLLKDPCICLYIGTWIEASNFRQYGRNWDSVGMYNTGPSPKLIKQRREYAAIIKSIYRVLISRDEVYAAMSQHNKKTPAPEKFFSANINTEKNTPGIRGQLS